jgi:hypothetical protein
MTLVPPGRSGPPVDVAADAAAMPAPRPSATAVPRQSPGPGIVGIIANPVSGKDIRRLVANASTSTLADKYTIIRRAVIGAAEVGVERFLFLGEPHHLGRRATETLSLPCRYDDVAIDHHYDESDTVRTAATMREAGAGAVVVLGGDGTNRATALGWRDAPLVAVSTGTNNVFPSFVEATVAGEAAGLVACGHVGLREVARPAKVVEVRVDGEPDDLALVDAVLVDERFVGSRALYEPATLRLAVLSRAEPAAVGVSSVGGLLEPCGPEEEGGVLVRFGALAAAPRRLRAPLAPGWYATVGVASCERLGPDEPVEERGPGILAFDGERQRILRRGQRARLRVRRAGPWVIDTGRALHLAARRAVFVGAAHH